MAKIINPSKLEGVEKTIFQGFMMMNRFEWVCPYIDKTGKKVNKAAWCNGILIIPEDKMLIDIDEFRKRVQYTQV